MEFHPIANAFPLMEGEEFKELVKDIAKNGQQQPILTYEGKILDGRNRYCACLEAGVEPWVEGWSGISPVEAVLSLNLHRRHLSSSQRAVVASRMLAHLEAEAKKRQGARTDLTSGKEFPQVEKRAPERATAEAAKLTGTNPRYVSDAKRLAKEAPEELARVERGETTIPKAKRAVRPPDKPLSGEDRTTAREALGDGGDLDLGSWDLTKEQKAYWDISKHLVAISRLDPVTVAEGVRDEGDAEKRLNHVDGFLDWFGRYRSEVEKRREELRPGNLRAVGGGRG